MISVDEALGHLFALAEPLATEEVPLRAAAGRVLAVPVAARTDQPPFHAAAMDGYALHARDARRGAELRVVGEAAAGRPFAGPVAAGEAVRIFPGAPVPAGLDCVVIQEEVRREGAAVTLLSDPPETRNIRERGCDFARGTPMAPRRLGPRDVALLAAMNHAVVPVRRRPEIALIATGDELVWPGATLADGAITASSIFGLAGQLEAAGALVRLLPIAADRPETLRRVLALAEGADLIVTTGGASVGDHDLVGRPDAIGSTLSFHKVAMRPGKPLLAGRVAGRALVGLPGNPVAAMVCAVIFLQPMLRAMLGLGASPAPRVRLAVGMDLDANGPREHYMRATIADGAAIADPRQDSSLLSVLAASQGLLVRPPNDGPRLVGEMAEVVLL